MHLRGNDSGIARISAVCDSNTLKSLLYDKGITFFQIKLNHSKLISNIQKHSQLFILRECRFLAAI